MHLRQQAGDEDNAPTARRSLRFLSTGVIPGRHQGLKDLKDLHSDRAP